MLISSCSRVVVAFVSLVWRRRRLLARSVARQFIIRAVVVVVLIRARRIVLGAGRLALLRRFGRHTVRPSAFALAFRATYIVGLALRRGMRRGVVSVLWARVLGWFSRRRRGGVGVGEGGAVARCSSRVALGRRRSVGVLSRGVVSIGARCRWSLRITVSSVVRWRHWI